MRHSDGSQTVAAHVRAERLRGFALGNGLDLRAAQRNYMPYAGAARPQSLAG
jgi:hypothetical protein